MPLQKQNNIFENKFPCMVNFALCDDDDGLSCSLRYIPYAYIYIVHTYSCRYVPNNKICIFKEMVWVILHLHTPLHLPTPQVTVYASKCHRCVLFCRMFNKHEESVFSYIIFERDENGMYVTKTCFYLLMNKLTF